jgi:hypothetical protein
MGFENLNEFLWIIYLLFKENKVCHLPYEIIAHTNLWQLWCFVEFRIIHAEVNDLFVINYGN